MANRWPIFEVIGCKATYIMESQKEIIHKNPNVHGT